MVRDYTLKCADEKQQFESGAVRDKQTGKGRFDLLPSRAMTRLARHFEKGGQKYGDNNWLKGIPINRYLDSALRHVFAYMEGKDDEDHLVSAMWNLVAAVETESRIEEGVLPLRLQNTGPESRQHPELTKVDENAPRSESKVASGTSER